MDCDAFVELQHIRKMSLSSCPMMGSYPDQKTSSKNMRRLQERRFTGSSRSACSSAPGGASRCRPIASLIDGRRVQLNWSEVTRKVVTIIQTWYDQKVSLLGMVEMMRVLIAFVITYELDVVPCPDPLLNNLERILCCLLWKRKKPLARRCICCQKPLQGRLGMPSLTIRKCALKLRHLWLNLDDQQVLLIARKVPFSAIIVLIRNKYRD